MQLTVGKKWSVRKSFYAFYLVTFFLYVVCNLIACDHSKHIVKVIWLHSD